MANIALLGHGVVGSGVAEVLLKNKQSLEAKLGEEIHLAHILDLREFDVPYKQRFTKDFDVILNDKLVDIVVEVMGGLNPAYDFVKASLLSGKSVVSSNKELVASKGAELLRLARENNVNFLFEASVGGGIPIIRPMHQCLAANEIKEVAGILNGTTNYILTKMIREQTSFADALTLAQSLGYAERDPSADVDGHDACRKICILASLAYGKHVYPAQVQTEGITAVTLADVAYAESAGCVIKLIGRCKKLDSGKLEIIVSPALLPRDSQLGGVDDVFNGILVRGDATGDVVFYGKGAGKLPTASAVVADIIDEIKHKDTIRTLYWEDGEDSYVQDSADYRTRLYLCLKADDQGAALAVAQRLYGEVTPLARNASAGECAFLTPERSEREHSQIKQALSDAGYPLIASIRMLDY